jgi:hypothetical protein
MNAQASFVWLLPVLALVLAGVGLVWMVAPSLGRQSRSAEGRGLEWETCRLSFPLVTCLFLGVLLSLVRWLIRPFRD